MIHLSVNINKVATLRNSRDLNVPDLGEAIEICVAAGCHGITIHPRVDERHIRFADVPLVKQAIAGRVELNIECDPGDPFIDLVLRNAPTQCTLVPTKPQEITSSEGFDLTRDGPSLRGKIGQLKAAGIRTSLFLGTELRQVELARELGSDAVEFYTGVYALTAPGPERDAEYDRLYQAAELAQKLGLRVHCGHDLTVENLGPIARLPGLCEVSIGHHLLARAMFLGLPQTIREHLKTLQPDSPA